MSAVIAPLNAADAARASRAEPPYVPAATQEPTWVRLLLIAIALGFAFLFLLVPLAVVFT